MHAPIKYFEKGLSYAANGAWVVFNSSTRSTNPAFTPKWSEKPLLKSYQKTKPPLGWPRETDSLCPVCARSAAGDPRRQEGRRAYSSTKRSVKSKPRSSSATGKILMVKECPVHGHFEDMMAVDVKFLEHLEQVFPGRDIDAHNDAKLHNHGSSTIKHGRGSVLTVDLTNRCNMMCDPCFMDANQVGFVHELTWEDIKEILDNAITIKPRRQMSIQFSGGEPTLSPYFLDAIAYARKVGYNSVQARPTASSSPRIRNSPKRPLKRACATPTCSSTASATPPTRTAASATCSTSSCGRSRTCTARASTSSRS